MASPDESGTHVIRVPSGQGLSLHFKAVDLCVTAGPDLGAEASFGLPLLRIGTAADNDLILTDRSVSRHHAEIRTTPQGLLLRDLNSTNGTLVGQLRVTEAYLGPDTEIGLGYTRLRVRQHTEERRVAVSEQDHLGALVGASRRMRELYGLIRAVAPTPTTVLITGESGCGKELVAATLHELSGRTGPLVVFDASVTDPEMVRNDLFGHIKGAFTGATASRAGAFRHAHTGTLFIDEIGELPLDLQPRLLRALENREVTPVGADKPVRVDVRVIAATNRDLTAMVQAGTFRADLYYRLSVVPVRVPALREIKEDIPLLVQSFIERLGLSCQVTAEALAALQGYAWPGNVRELRNVLERAAALSGGTVQAADLRLSSEPLTQPSGGRSENLLPSTDSRTQLRQLERDMIMETLARNGNNKAAAARELGIPLSTLKRRLREYDS